MKLREKNAARIEAAQADRPSAQPGKHAVKGQTLDRLHAVRRIRQWQVTRY